MKWNTNTPPTEELLFVAIEVYDRHDKTYHTEYNVCYIDEEGNLFDQEGDVLGWMVYEVDRWVFIETLEEHLLKCE